jgi:hypothetical protein
MQPYQVIEWLRFAWMWLGEQGPAVQPGVVISLAFGIPWLLRTYLAIQWEAATDWATRKARPLLGEKLTAAFRKAIQGVPSLAIGAALGVLVHGGDVGAILSDQFYVVFAPLLHEALKRYQGGVYPAAGALKPAAQDTVSVRVVNLGDYNGDNAPSDHSEIGPKDGAA